MPVFNSNCHLCERLTDYLKSVRSEHPEYYSKPVPSFGDKTARLLIVGLAPGLHGANATGRPFTGDYAGILLYETLHKFGYASRPKSLHLEDGLKLRNCRITNAVKCLPPENKPTTTEINTCNQYLKAELEALKSSVVILALGQIAHKAVLKALKLKNRDFPFGHGNTYPLHGGRWLVDSYHCSRYNTQTRRLTEKMFHDIFSNIHELINIT